MEASNKLKLISAQNSDSSSFTAPVDGFYILSIEYSSQLTSALGSIESETYYCPFPDFYIDQSNVYQPCLQLPTTTKTDTFLQPFLDSAPAFDLGTVIENSIIRIKLVLSSRYLLHVILSNADIMN